MYANEETIQAIIDETLLRIPDKDEHKQFWKNTCIDITNFENKSIENLEPGAYIHYGALNSVYDLFPIKSFNVKRNPETVAILTSCEMFVLEIDRRYKQLEYQVSGDDYIQFTDFAGTLYVYNATDIDGDTGNFIKQFNFLWHSSSIKNTIPWYNQNVFFQEYVDNEYISTTFGYDSIVHKKGSDEYVYSFPEKTGTIALLENIPTKLSDLTNDSGYITIGSVGNGTLTIQKNGTTVQTFSANQSSNSTANITVPTKLSDLTNDTGYITIGSVGNGTLTITQNGTSKGTFSANQSGNSTVDITVPTKTSDLTNDSGYTTNIGTVTQVKVGSTAYNPSSGIVSLPAYPTTLPASDVYAWAKASTKPSYSYSEISGTPTIPTSANYLERGAWWSDASSLNVDDLRDGIHFVYSSHGAPVTGTLVTFSGEGAGASPGYCWQMILGYDNGTNLFVRNRNGDYPGTWGVWRKMARADEIPTKVSELTNDSGYTTNIGTVTQVKVGSTAYNPSSGIVSLPAYPTTLPASDVYSWAKASEKPSYYYKELLGEDTRFENSAPSAYQTNKSGSTEFIEFKVRATIGAPGSSNYGALKTINPWGDSSGGLPVQFYTDNTGVFAYRCATSESAWGAWQSIARTSEIPTKLSELTNDSGYITSSGSCANADTLQNSAPDEGTGASTIVKRTSTGQVKAFYYNMSGEENNINSFTSHVAFVCSDGWIRKTSKANFSTWLLTWTKLGSTTGNTQLSYTGTYTEFFVILDLGFYAETFYFVASALGAGRHFFGGTTNTSDGSSWVLYARRSNTTYYFMADRVHQDGTDYTSQVNVSVYAR